jgi:serine/threonine protein kinase
VSSDRVQTPTTVKSLDLVEVVQQLSLARSLATVQEIVRRSARQLTGADGATFVLRDGDQCHYADEDAISPLWKGQRFPMSACISGWTMLNCQPAVIEDVYADSRIPHDAYRPTFVKSLVMVPIRKLDPIGAIGTYWARKHHASAAEVRLLQALADSTAVALDNVRLFAELEDRVRARTLELEAANRQLERTNSELITAQEQADRVFSTYSRSLLGTVLDGKYRLDEELGSGGFGVVFRGWHLTLDCPIAVKVFRPAAGNDSGRGLQRFLREGATAARLDHPNAVRVLDSGVSSEGVAYLIMEFLEGRSLAKELAERGPLPLWSCASIGGKVAEVLAAAHRQGILHRDIKPDNIFLHRANGQEVVKVVDFGIARFIQSTTGPDVDRLTRTGEYIMGTPSFVAPERLTGGPDDGRSDVFSLGTTLYQMICGAHPWTRQQLARLAAGEATDLQPVPMEKHRPGVPSVLERLVVRTLAAEAVVRPTALELAVTLAKLAESIDETPSAPGLPRQPLDAASTLDVTVERWDPPETK